MAEGSEALSYGEKLLQEKMGGTRQGAYAPPPAAAKRTAAPRPPAAQTGRPAQSPDQQAKKEQPKQEQPAAPAASRTPALAVGGKRISDIPDPQQVPTWPSPDTGEEVYVPDDQYDFVDLNAVNTALNQARSRLFRITNHLRDAQRSRVDKEIVYKREMRRALISITGGSAELRKAMAEVQCEGHENDMIVAQQIEEEWKRRVVVARDDLDALQNLSHNIRAQVTSH